MGGVRMSSRAILNQKERFSSDASSRDPMRGSLYGRGRVYSTIDNNRPLEIFRQTIPYPTGAERRANNKIASLTGETLELTIQQDKLELYQIVEQLLNEDPVQQVDLSEHNMGDDDIDYLCTALGQATTVTEVVLDGNRISDKGVQTLASALTRNTSVTSLCLRNNKINTAGLEALALMLEYNSTLRAIELDGNPAFASSPLDDLWRQQKIRSNNTARTQIIQTMENHADGSYYDNQKSEREIEQVKTDAGLERYMEELQALGQTDIPAAVLAGLSEEEREAVEAKVQLLRQYEHDMLGGVLEEVSYQELASHNKAKAATELAAANNTLVMSAAARVAGLQAELHAAMLDEEFVLEQQVMVERMASEAKESEHALGVARQSALAKRDRIASQLQV